MRAPDTTAGPYGSLTEPRATRLEHKHCVSEAVAEQVLRIARMFLQPEPGLRFGQSQQITSLYLDTRDLRFARWHRSGAPDRFKLRVRVYGGLPPATVFAEIKRKRNGLGSKHRAEVPYDWLPRVLDGMPPAASSRLGEFVGRRLAYAAVPQLLTRSVRESLRGGNNDQTAVTVDRALAWRPAAADPLDHELRDWRPVVLPQHTGPATVVVEVKYGPRPPQWMRPLLASLAPYRLSFSKYIAAAETMRPWEIG